MVRIKRAYEAASASDGCRVLVDRLWPRGVSKERAQLDEWLKEVAPSPALRAWWNHDPERMHEFALRYRAELDSVAETQVAVAALRALAAAGITTLIYGAKDPQVNHARVLAEYLAE
ncbi:DUF488 family protein [Cryobacterium sp. PH31-L1]|uniref:DUF488 domain-containing protein n=1 Tax=Cryobacterium sp. PH31-L1 TaxID=3046199 RepID=UPI0024BB7D04|nr:DUF488 family protein [Cryobacterium sp. PH31-L1]MDJ0376893.1 DUF488 family protein [Cryobacterium sp. PH31-L1]